MFLQCLAVEIKRNNLNNMRGSKFVTGGWLSFRTLFQFKDPTNFFGIQRFRIDTGIILHRIHAVSLNGKTSPRYKTFKTFAPFKQGLTVLIHVTWITSKSLFKDIARREKVSCGFFPDLFAIFTC